MTLNTTLLTFSLGVLVPPPSYFQNNGRFKGRVDFATTTTAITLVAEVLFGKLAATLSLTALLLYGVYSLGKRIFAKKNPDSSLDTSARDERAANALKQESALDRKTDALLKKATAADTPQ